MSKQLSSQKLENYATYDPFLSLHCKNCDATISADNININKTLAKCDNCGSVFGFEDDVFFQNRRGRPEIVMPEGVEVLNLLTSMEIELSWFKSMKRSSIAFEVMFTVLWNVMLFGIIIGMLVSGMGFPLLFLSIHLIVGLGLAYRLFSKFINKTKITINNRGINIEHGPLKSFSRKNLNIKQQDLSQLYVSEYTTNIEINDQPQRAYGLFAILKGDKKIRLIKDCNKETALYLEQEIERHLEIEDYTVRGEIKE